MVHVGNVCGKTDLMIGVMPDERDATFQSSQRVGVSHTNKDIVKCAILMVFPIVAWLFFGGIFSCSMAMVALVSVYLILGHRSTLCKPIQFLCEKFGGLDLMKNDGRTRPKLFSNFSRGWLCNIRISKSDLRSAWPLQVQYCDLPALQKEDDDFSCMITWLESGKRPDSKMVQNKSPILRHYWLLWDSLTMKDGILHRWFYRQNGSSYLQVVVPKCLQREVLFHMHDSILSGHLGYKKTRDKLLQSFYWFNVRQDVHTHVQACDKCSSVKQPPKKPKAPLGNMVSGAPLDRVSTDITGPFPVSLNGNKYILVVTDYFTKWVEIYAIPDQTAYTCAEKILNEFICRYGCPYDLHSDQGTNYTSKLFTELCKLLEIRKTKSSPYRPQGNGQVERFNRTLISMIKMYLSDEGRDWDKNLGCLAGAYRATMHESTGFTPNFLFFGREVRLPAHLSFSAPNSLHSSYGEYVFSVKEKMERAHELARQHLNRSVQRQKVFYDAKSTLHSYAPGDLVWYHNPAMQTHLPPKLRKAYIGPMLVLERKNDLTYTILTNSKKETKVVHHDKLLSYRGTQRPPWIRNALKLLKQKQLKA